MVGMMQKDKYLQSLTSDTCRLEVIVNCGVNLGKTQLAGTKDADAKMQKATANFGHKF